MDNGGDYYADGSSLSGITNRAIGLIATTKSGIVAFGAAFINNTPNALNLINLSYLGELWRNNPNQQVLQFGYAIDPAGSNSVFQPSQWDSTNGIVYIPALDVTFPTSADTEILDGTQAINQTNLATSGLAITNWPPGAALWLIWQGQTLGSAQDVAIDNLSFSASSAAVAGSGTPPSLSGFLLRGDSFRFSFTNAPGLSYTVLSTTDVALPLSQWQILGHPTEAPAGWYQFTDTQLATNLRVFYRVRQP